MLADHRYGLIGAIERAVWFALPPLVVCPYQTAFLDGNMPKLIAASAMAMLLACVLWRARFDILDAAIALLAVYAGLSIGWSVDPWGAVDAYLAWPVFAIVAIAARRCEDFRPVQWGVVLAVFIALGSEIALPEYFAGFGNENFAAAWFVVAIPFVIGLCSLWRWPILHPLVFLIAAICVYLLFFNAAKVEFIALAALLLYFGVRGGYWPWIVIALCVIVTSICLLMLGTEGWSLTTRLYLWWSGAQMILDRPFFGAGIGGFDTLYSVYALPNDKIVYFSVFAAGAAHNDWLQIVTDLGFLGLGMVAIVLFLAWKRASGPEWAWYVLAITAVLMLFGFPMQRAAYALMAVLAFGALCPAERVAEPVHWYRLMPQAFAVGLLIMILPAIWKAEAAFSMTNNYIRQHPIAAHLWNEEALRHWPYDKHMRRELLLTAVRSTADNDAVHRGLLAARSAYWNHPLIERIARNIEHES